ncbi:MAG: glycosyltransferase [Thermoguttaceae bacterium]|jgi:GT2 family glycosyltransferase|nr:glycosyltransferase [Thermoguttaceae bacterium]
MPVRRLLVMNKPMISVNICVWRPHPGYFRQAVESILAQTMPDFELVIVEDPSETSGREAIGPALGDPRIRYHCNEERTGLIAQRNRAIELSRAEWIAVLDADDVAKPDRLARQYERISRDPAVSVVGSWLEIIGAEGNVIGIRRYPADHNRIARAMRRYNAIAQPAVLFRRAAAMKVGCYQGKPYTEDYDLWCRMLRAGCSFANVAETLVSYRIHDAASKSAHLRDVLAQTIEIKRRHFADGLEVGDRLRLAAERLLMMLPPRVVYWLFCALTYPRRKPRSRSVARSAGA